MTGVQALERKHADLPMQPGHVLRREFEYIRHGTRCLIGSLGVPTGQVFGSVTARRGRWDFVRHIRDVVVQFPKVKKWFGKA